MDWKVTSIGSICFCKWNICMKLDVPYISSPFDNVQNLSVYQFENIREMIQMDYSQIETGMLEKRYQVGKRIADGKQVMYKGYKYVGQELAREFILAHFFDDARPNVWLDYDEAWRRWWHKCGNLRTALSDRANGLLLVSLRLNSGGENDTPYRRDYLARSLRRLARLFRDRYERTPKDCHIISLVTSSDVTKTIVEADEPFFRQVVVPSGPETNMPYWERKPRQEYIDIVKQYMESFQP